LFEKPNLFEILNRFAKQIELIRITNQNALVKANKSCCTINNIRLSVSMQYQAISSSVT